MIRGIDTWRNWWQNPGNYTMGNNQYMPKCVSSFDLHNLMASCVILMAFVIFILCTCSVAQCWAPRCLWRWVKNTEYPHNQLGPRWGADQSITGKKKHPWWQGSWGQRGAHLGPTGPRWTPCWPHELCYLGYGVGVRIAVLVERRRLYIERVA